MEVTVKKSSNSIGPLKVISSKSLGHRAVIAASLAAGESVISNFKMSKDMEATISAMEALGAKIQVNGNRLIINGIESFSSLKSNDIDCFESGSTIRFLIPVFSLTKQELRFRGSKRLLERPQDVYEKIFKSQKLEFQYHENYILTKGILKAGKYEVMGNISSQFITGLLFTLPLLQGDSIIKILGKFESKSYVDLTIDVLKLFGIKIDIINENEFFISGNQKYMPYNYEIETDFSQLAFFAVLAAINSDLKFSNVNLSSKQGDKAILKILESFNVDIDYLDNELLVKKSNLVANKIDLQDCPDLGPILMVLASISRGKSHFINASRLRIKESDRIAAMEAELRKLNVNISSVNDQIWVENSDLKVLNNVLDSHNDHRIAMALTIIATIVDEDVVITNAQAINKSYPTFYKDIESIGIEVLFDE